MPLTLSSIFYNSWILLIINSVAILALIAIVCYKHRKGVQPVCRDGGTSSDEHEKETEFYQQLYERILAVMEHEQLYLKPDLTLKDLASKAMTNRTHLSNAINRVAHQNFNVWLSEYRVNYFIQLVNDKKNTQIDQLYREAGFPSRSSFYRQFKQIKGITPKQFITQLTGLPCTRP